MSGKFWKSRQRVRHFLSENALISHRADPGTIRRNLYAGHCYPCNAPVEPDDSWVVWTGRRWLKLCCDCYAAGKATELIRASR